VTNPVFVDTSALYATLDADDANHDPAALAWSALLDRMTDDPFAGVTHSGVITEIAALVQRRLGMQAVTTLLDDVVPLFDVTWIDERLHRLAVTALVAAGDRQVSLVDWTSFVLMRELGIDTAFAYDTDFERQGFRSFGP
jgi:predicted nucleic acid-binding protein